MASFSYKFSLLWQEKFNTGCIPSNKRKWRAEWVRNIFLFSRTRTQILDFYFVVEHSRCRPHCIMPRPAQNHLGRVLINEPCLSLALPALLHLEDLIRSQSARTHFVVAPHVGLLTLHRCGMKPRPGKPGFLGVYAHWIGCSSKDKKPIQQEL